MKEYVSFHKILDYIKEYQVASPRLNDFGYGDIIYFCNDSGTTTNYPFLFVTPLNASYDENTTTYNLQLIFADIVNTDLSNEKDVVSDMSLEARRFLSEIKRGFLRDDVDVVLPAQAQSFFERFNDHVGGMVLNVDIVVFEDINACDFYPPAVTPSNTPTNTATPTNTPTNTATPTSTPLPPSPTATPTLTPTPTETPLPTLLSFVVYSGESQYLACNNPTPTTIYAQDLGNCGGCSPLTCWACLSTAQPIYSDSGGTTLVTDGYYMNYMTPPSSSPGIWYIYDGYPQGGGFFGGCPPSPSPTPSAPANHPYSWTGYVSPDSYCEAYSGTNRTAVTLYGDNSAFDLNLVFYDSPSGGNSTNLFGNYAMDDGFGTYICTQLDYDGRLILGYYLCSAFCP